MWLYDDVLAEVQEAPELGVKIREAREPKSGPDPKRPKPSKPFPPRWPRNDQKLPIDQINELNEKWNVVAEVAEGYPRLLTWLAEGRASRYWNVFGAWVAILRLIPVVRSVLVWRRLFWPVSQRAAWRPALYEAMMQARREALNAEDDRYGDMMTIRGPGIPGLSAVTDVSVITQTQARAEVRQKIVNMTSGCIGISGLRGSGKSTLIRDICAHRYGTPRYRSPGDIIAPEDALPGLRLMVQAPLAFEPRDFLIHQYTCLCRAVLADVRFNPTKPTDVALGPVLLPRSIRPAALIGSLSGIALFFLSAGLAFHVIYGGWPFFSLHTRSWEVVGVIAAFCAALIAFAWRTRRTLIEIRQVNKLAVDADARLRKLHFQRADTRSRGGAVGGPMGTGLNIGTTRQLVEQAMSLPELIDDYRDFVERVVGALQEEWRKEWRKRKEKPKTEEDRKERRRRGAAKYPGTDARLVIGIDALDQIDNPGEACKLLEDLGATFGIPYCVHLISLSPGTLAAVDQRTVPLKTFSGGMFDEMVWLEPLGPNDACKFLDQRVTGLPACFIALIYVLSGGLPRELVRIARAIFPDSGGQPERWEDPSRPVAVRLADAAKHVIDAEIRALKHRTLASTAALEVSGSAKLLKLLTDESWPECLLGPYGLFLGHHDPVAGVLDEVSSLCETAVPRRPASSDSGGDDLFTAEVCDSFLAGLYFLLTARQLFTAGAGLVTRLACEDRDGHRHHEQGNDDWLNDRAPVLRYLAGARIALGVSPYLATSLIHEARGNPGHPGPRFAPDIEPRFLNQGAVLST